MRTRLRVLALLVTLGAAPAEAEFYKWALPDGTIEYSDRPPVEGAERVELRPLVTYTPTAIPEQSAGSKAKIPEPAEGYDSFSIASPANDATVRSPGSGNISLSVAVSPSLIQGHAIEIFVDGRKFGRSELPTVTLKNVDRGTHQIHAAIIDDSGAELVRTETITVHLYR